MYHAIYQSFAPTHTLSPRWRHYLVGSGAYEQHETSRRLTTANATAQQYSDAQLDDYQIGNGDYFPWHAPLRMTIRARFSHPSGMLRGTAGFGFWNYPFLIPEGRLPTLPRAIWFFYASPPSDMKLDMLTPGYGWKAATIDTLRPASLLLAPLAPLLVPLMNLPGGYCLTWPVVQHALAIQETLLPVMMTDWHVYTIEWGTQSSRLSVDGQVVLDKASSPRGNLCFVMWLDNQYLIVRPWGRFSWGLLDVPGQQWLDVDWLAIETG